MGTMTDGSDIARIRKHVEEWGGLNREDAEGLLALADQSYNGYANRETWAFNLHWQNDQGLYNETLRYAADVMRDLDDEGNDLDRGDGFGSSVTDYGLGKKVVAYWREQIEDDMNEQLIPRRRSPLRMMRDEVGSWWRIDYREVGEAVRESLDAES